MAAHLCLHGPERLRKEEQVIDSQDMLKPFLSTEERLYCRVNQLGKSLHGTPNIPLATPSEGLYGFLKGSCFSIHPPSAAWTRTASPSACYPKAEPVPGTHCLLYLLCQLLKANGPLLGRCPIDSLPDVGVPGVGLGGRKSSSCGQCSELGEVLYPLH